MTGPRRDDLLPPAYAARCREHPPEGWFRSSGTSPYLASLPALQKRRWETPPASMSHKLWGLCCTVNPTSSGYCPLEPSGVGCQCRTVSYSGGRLEYPIRATWSCPRRSTVPRSAEEAERIRIRLGDGSNSTGGVECGKTPSRRARGSRASPERSHVLIPRPSDIPGSPQQCQDFSAPCSLIVLKVRLSERPEGHVGGERQLADSAQHAG